MGLDFAAIDLCNHQRPMGLGQAKHLFKYVQGLSQQPFLQLLKAQIEVEETIAKSKTKIRANQRYAKRTLKGEVKEQRKVGLPPYKVQVTKNGKINAACDGKNEWDNAL